MLYALVDQHGGIRVSMTYRESRISTPLAAQLGDYFALSISLILQHPHSALSDLHLLSIKDHQRLLQWNEPLPEPRSECVHQVIAQRVREQPDLLAVSGFDGEFTYADLYQQSMQLAAFLVSRGVAPKACVPVCFEKSRWTTVAVLAVMTAGATFVPLDPSHPFTRLQELCHRVDAAFIISSVTQAPMCQSLAENVIVVGDTTSSYNKDIVADVNTDLATSVGPEQSAYIIFTSGTTGSPKGVMIPHSSYTSAADAQIRAFSIGRGSRVLQFSSYAFDVSVMEILTTLMAGGTVCVISEAERSRMMLNGVCPLTVTHAFLTPSVSGLLDAGRASWVETLVLLGEPMSTSHIKQWANVCRLMNAYGPTECAVLNTSTGRILPGDDPKNMGHSLEVHFWVVDQNDHNRLLPMGAVGELILSGPPVGKGYVGDAKKSASAFIQPPRWLQQLFPEASSWRLYKTGDLVRYDISSGCLRYEGRKDRQIKVRGQRVELEDIEHHTRRYFPRAADVVVEQVKLPEDLPTGTGDMSTIQPRIIACVCWKGPNGHSGANKTLTTDGNLAKDPKNLLAGPSREFYADAAATTVQLRDALPGFMVPDLFLPILQVPRQKSGKTDRTRLREAILAVEPEYRYSTLSAAEVKKRPPSSETERKFHVILSHLLNLPQHEVGVDDSLFHLGGDSIVAMKITANAEASGLNISLQEILRTPTIQGWASAVNMKDTTSPIPQPRPSLPLITDTHYAEIVRLFFSKNPPFAKDNVEDILPVLESQSYYLDSSSIVSFAELFPITLDIPRLRMACSKVVSQYSILRTVFVEHDDRFFQVILRSVEPEFSLLECEDPEAYLSFETKRRIAPSTPRGVIPVSFSVVTSSTSNKCAFIARLSHAQYDGACLNILWKAIGAAYQGETLSVAAKLGDVVHHRLGHNHPDSLTFWRTYLHGASMRALDPLHITPSPGVPENQASSRTSCREIRQPAPLTEATVATLIKAVLAWLFSQHNSQSDIILGQVVHGRGSSLPNIDKVFGPCVTFLPIRITADSDWTVSDLLRHVQSQQVATVPHDAVTLKDISRNCTDWPEDVKFGCLVHHQPLDPQSAPFELDGVRSYSNVTWANSEPPAGQIDVISIERETGLDIVIASPNNMLDQDTIEWMADRLSETIGLFSNFPNCPLAELWPETVQASRRGKADHSISSNAVLYPTAAVLNS